MKYYKYLPKDFDSKNDFFTEEVLEIYKKYIENKNGRIKIYDVTRFIDKNKFNKSKEE